MNYYQKIKQYCYFKIVDIWYRDKLPWYLWCLLPISWIFYLIVTIRKFLYSAIQYKAKVPVIIVGNISVGGTGKTPTVIAIVKYLTTLGYQPGIITRGYRAHSECNQAVFFATANSDPAIVGDEALLLARVTSVPVVVSKNRVMAVKNLLAQYSKVDIIVSDDGLQHYKLARNIEIAVINKWRKHGNRILLPLGPLREPCSRLKSVDLLVYPTIKPLRVTNLVDQKLYYPLNKFAALYKNTKIHAIAGIANPTSFFKLLRDAGCNIIPHSYEDHHAFNKSEIIFSDNNPVIMTAKDAVKCATMATRDYWVLDIEVALPQDFYDELKVLLERRV